MLGIPIIFLLVSVANMAFAMMTFHTMQEAVEQGARYVATRGSSCSSGTNTCAVTVGNITSAIQADAAGIAPALLNVTLTTNSGAVTTCSPVTSCTSSSTSWPPSSNSDNSPGKDIIISATYTCTSPIAMFWPGVASDKFGNTTFNAYSRQRLMF
jgi:Flp pilus assembly protein TadG